MAISLRSVAITDALLSRAVTCAPAVPLTDTTVLLIEPHRLTYCHRQQMSRDIRLNRWLEAGHDVVPTRSSSVNSMYLMLKIIIMHIYLDSPSLLCYKIASDTGHDRAR
jgi:hypothetical protein